MADYTPGTYEAQLKSAGIDPGKYLNTEGFGGSINPTEYQTILSREGASPSQVYSANNIQNQASPYDTGDLLGIRNQIYDELGVKSAREAYGVAYKDYLDYQTGTDTAQNLVENQAINLNAIRGEQGEIGRQRGVTTAAKARGLEALGMRLSSLENEALQQFNIRSGEVEQKRQAMLQYAGAGIKYGDSWESVSGKVKAFNDSQLIQNLKIQYPTLAGKIKKGMDFDTAIAALGKGLKKQELQSQFAQVFGYTPTGMSSAKIKSKIKSYFKSEKKKADAESEMRLESMRIDLAKKKGAASGGGVSGPSLVSGPTIADLYTNNPSAGTSPAPSTGGTSDPLGLMGY